MSNPNLNKLFSTSSTSASMPVNNTTMTVDDIDDNDLDLPYAPVVIAPEAQPINKQDLTNDIDYSRRSIHSMIEKSQQLLELALENASNGSSPRDIEVATGVINSCADAAERLLNIHERLQKLSGKIDTGTGNTFVNNNNKTIVCTTSELLNQIINNEEMLNESSD